MSSGLQGRTDLPPSAAKHPYRYLLHGLRPVARWVIRRRYRVTVHGAEHVPASGPVILASNHVGVLDGPLMAIYAPRPVHALTKEEMFEGALGRFLLHSGQVPLDRFHSDPAAVRTCVRVLRDGGVVGIFPEGARGPGEFERFHLGAAYLGLVSGAPIVPVIQFGTREPGGHSGSLPDRGHHIELVFGPPLATTAAPWPRTKEQVEGASVLLREHLLAQLAAARALTGRELPGPLPPGDHDIDPATGITEQGAP
ncbi:1-acyl-sn-glycerol-3-phosphate acyltransferase [Nocardioides sp. SYSU D00038]|uniref:lysophospholipid acyltransferase family protein n=1 Tax=Nocardioides sp. SYSU D00038 TaxID=2812554 RepID=UPI001968851A|nr:lysophospholipid acyltransferase family protein [Nocardioides sp. SYSU D00038]